MKQLAKAQAESGFFAGLTYVERAGEFPQRPGRLSYIYGLALQETNLPSKAMGQKLAQMILARLVAQDYPHVVELTVSTSCNPVTTTTTSSGSTLSWTAWKGPAAQPDPLSHRDSPPK